MLPRWPAQLNASLLHPLKFALLKIQNSTSQHPTQLTSLQIENTSLMSFSILLSYTLHLFDFVTLPIENTPSVPFDAQLDLQTKQLLKITNLV